MKKHMLPVGYTFENIPGYRLTVYELISEYEADMLITLAEFDYKKPLYRVILKRLSTSHLLIYSERQITQNQFKLVEAITDCGVMVATVV